MSYQTLDAHTKTLALWYIVNTSLQSYYKLIESFGGAEQALEADVSAWQALSLHKAHIGRYQDAQDVLAFVDKVQNDVARGAYGALYQGDAAYPDALDEIYDPPPVLFYRGNVARLSERQIAIVGSRKPSEYAEKITFDLAQYLVQSGYTITSGLAQGVDKSAHLGALAQSAALAGRTVGVAGTGIDVCYPKNHHALFAQIINDGGCIVSELLPGTPASKHTFPRRNRLVAGLSLATVVTEAALQSGSLITARLAAEQGKQVFAVPSRIDNANAEGCHHLIREGATLIYHPNHIIDEIASAHTFNALPKTFSQGVSAYGDEGFTATQTKLSSNFDKNTIKNQQVNINSEISSVSPQTVPEHLLAVFGCVNQTAVDLDTLVEMTGLDTGSLLAQLIELEILGVIAQQGGRYVRL
ncbi:DNA protecting protein DprA [Moraxella caviae]|uniref:DNA protecting protein DprA n=1 Tax=Moraxella caviae TaxID=34060 RepID=A0A1S9ZXD0_9GAMM|nr:DNA-processing protein DprA [Moraxella caviae]OOR88172.1 DNA protecting protein DprA [Moraxella caviae]STZ10526.1 DNA protecting protein DprA [Moraxella caviae]